MGIFEKFKLGFKKSASTFTSGLKEIIIKKEIDDKTLNEIEDFLIQSDVGVAASEEIRNIIAEKKIDIQSIDGSGKDGRILKGDLLSLMGAQPQPSQRKAQYGLEEKIRMTRLRQTIAKRLKQA